MYSVVRFTTNADLVAKLAELGREMNSIRSGIFNGIRKRGDGFSCEVCSESSWAAHEVQVIQFISDFQQIIARARLIGACVTLDVAIEPEDRGSTQTLVLSCKEELVSLLSLSGVRMELTIY